MGFNCASPASRYRQQRRRLLLFAGAEMARHLFARSPAERSPRKARPWAEIMECFQNIYALGHRHVACALRRCFGRQFYDLKTVDFGGKQGTRGTTYGNAT